MQDARALLLLRLAIGAELVVVPRIGIEGLLGELFLARALVEFDFIKAGFDEGPVYDTSYDYLKNAGVEVVRRMLRDDAKAVLDSYLHSGGTIYNG
mgnify:CR=1 FL=1